MRLGLLIKDAEYRAALAERLATFDNDLFVNILDGKGKDTSYSLILTDIQPEELDPSVLDSLRARTVFITGTEGKSFEGCHSVFKYASVSSLIASLSGVYNEWHGTGPGRSHASRLLSVCSENDSCAGIKCLQLARQIIYGIGGRLLIIPLSYINDYGSPDYAEKIILPRLLYSMRTGRFGSADEYTFTDSYGVSYLSLPPGINPLAYLDEEELRLVITGFEAHFDTIICDVCNCFRQENIAVLKESESVICFEHGRRDLGLKAVLGDPQSRLIRITMSDGPEEASLIDEVIGEIYGTGRTDDINKGSNNTKIRD